MVIRWADPVSVFFDTYRNILYQSDISGQAAQSASIPCMFFPVGWKCQPEEGGIGPGCCHLPLASLYTSTPQNLNNTTDCIPHRPIPPSSGVPLYLQQKSPGAQQIQHCQTPEQKEQMSSGYSQSTSLLAHNRITAPQLIAFRSPAKDLIDPVKPQSLPIHCIRLTSRNISFIIQRTIITSQMPLHNIRIPHN